VIKTLFAHSGNSCAFMDPRDRRGCEEELTNPTWRHVMGRICHIVDRNPRSARYDPHLTCAEANAYDNLILLCPSHHARIDECEPDIFTAQVLRSMKERHEGVSESYRAWITDIDLEIVADLAIEEMHARDTWTQRSSTSSRADVSFRFRPGGQLRVWLRGPEPVTLLGVEVLLGNPSAITLSDSVGRVLRPNDELIVGAVDTRRLEEETVLRLSWTVLSTGRTLTKDLHIEMQDTD